MKQYKKLGQVFLHNPRILEKEAEIADVTGKTVFEIGPGDGRLSEKILLKNPKKLILVEKDTRFIELLKNRFSSDARIEIVNADILEYPLPFVDVIIGNIPYYISSSIIFGLKNNTCEKIILIVQKEFAEKMIAKPDDSNYGRLSVTSQLFFEVEYIMTVPKMFFSPPPKVDSALITLVPSGRKITHYEEEVINLLFQHKNQTVRSALKHAKKWDMKKLGILEEFLKRRVRTLTKEECLAIAQRLK